MATAGSIRRFGYPKTDVLPKHAIQASVDVLTRNLPPQNRRHAMGFQPFLGIRAVPTKPSGAANDSGSVGRKSGHASTQERRGRPVDPEEPKAGAMEIRPIQPRSM